VIDVLVPILTMGMLGFLFSAGLVIAYKRLRVEEDPKVEKVNEILPQAQCGACGFSGCRAYAEAVAKGEAELNSCPVGGEEVANQIAGIMGVKPAEFIKKVARLHCRGTREAAKDRGEYLGLSTCYAAHLLGGNKQCSYGCLGLGDCVQVCAFDALHMREDGLPLVSEEKCTACGKCVEACPRDLFELHALSRNIFVYCRSRDKGPFARKVCKNACIACGICVRACPEAIVLENFLAVIIDEDKIDPEKIPEIEKCPTDSIGRLKKGNEG
jgi:RnfABCDGE-type electron transport complex B subunit